MGSRLSVVGRLYLDRSSFFLVPFGLDSKKTSDPLLSYRFTEVFNQPKNYLYPRPPLELASLEELPREVFAFELLREGALDLFIVLRLRLVVSRFGACALFRLIEVLLLLGVVRVCL